MESKVTPDYKSTVILPVTNFPMRGNLPVKEPEILKRWNDLNLYQQMQTKNKGRPRFTLQDGPPYANGGIHIGHALNKILKDIIVKYKNMAGFETPFIPGWDCHGLPIEHKVTKDLGPKFSEKSPKEVRDLCRAEARKWIEVQKEQFQRLGILADWKNPYLTLDQKYEAEEVREFARAAEKGLVYLEKKPVYWNWFLQTALAEAEVEYHPHKSPSIYVKFPVKESSLLAILGATQEDNVSFLIWTTTPWTLPANLGVTLHPEFKYGVYRVQETNELWIFSQSLKESIEKASNKELSLQKTFLGQDVERKNVRHPFLEQNSLILLGKHVTEDTGTGVVHTAPGHGADDYRVGMAYGLSPYSPVDGRGLFTSDVPEFSGLHIFKANPLIIEKLRGLDLLVAHQDIEHSYPHCWRTKTPLIFRATPQWFLGLDLEGSKIRAKCLEALSTLNFVPKWGESRFRAMLEGRPDWCLSRQRLWGVPIPVLICKKTQQPLAIPEIMHRIADKMETNGGIEGFYATPVEELLDGKSYTKGDFGLEGFTHGQDILDVWFDSGVSHACVQKKREGLSFPADIYLEGSDQHRGWFNTSLLSSIATNGKAPYKGLITHGFVNDSQGLKMSKSKGNVVDPQDVAAKAGAEILRLWTAYEDYGQDLTCGPNELERVTETYRKLRNTVRYLLGSLDGFDFKKDEVAYENMTTIDQWILHELNVLIEDITTSYDAFSFFKIYHALNIFCTVKLSANYFDLLKDRMYTWQKNGRERRSSQTAFWHILDNLSRLMAPILSFLAEEVHEHRSDRQGDSIFLLPFPKANPSWKNPELSQKFEKLFEVRQKVQKELESLRANKVIGGSLEAQILLTAEDPEYSVMTTYPDLREFFVVSDVQVQKGAFSVVAKKAKGEKCLRCWIFSTEIAKSDAQFPGVCPKCVRALSA